MRSKLVPLGVVLIFGFSVLLVSGAPVRAGAPLYPDLKPLKPRQLQFDTVTINGVQRKVLRFTTIVWNKGQGPMELRGVTQESTKKTIVYQRFYDQNSQLVLEEKVGEFIWHEAHNHWHFENFAEYELWTKSEYEQWLASGRTRGQAQRRGTKTTFCILDSVKVRDLAGSPSSKVYDKCGVVLQGISVGWGDRYKYSLPEQWIDLGASILPNGDYALRVIADPRNQLFESPGKSTARRESNQANESVRFFRVSNGSITLLSG